MEILLAKYVHVNSAIKETVEATKKITAISLGMTVEEV